MFVSGKAATAPAALCKYLLVTQHLNPAPQQHEHMTGKLQHLQQRTPTSCATTLHVGISSKAMSIMNSFINDIFEKVSD
jgi:hypothetical protein